MRLNLLIALAVGLATYALTLYFNNRTPQVTQAPISVEAPIEGEITPEFSFTDINGKTNNIRDFEGKKIILNFWASWCPPCVKEFPLFLKAAAENKADTVFIALSSDHDATTMNRFVEQLDLENADNVFIALDENTKITNQIFQTYRLPETILIDQNQKMQRKLIGADWDYETLQSIRSSMQ